MTNNPAAATTINKSKGQEEAARLGERLFLHSIVMFLMS